MTFENREEAARLLLQRLMRYKDQNPLVLGIPRGAMPMAQIIADGLHGELNAILIHKIPFPQQEEYAIGSVGLSGEIYRLPTIKAYGIPDSYLTKTAQQQVEVLKKRKERFHLPDLNCKDRIVIIVDDGVATGATVLGAIHEVRLQKPKKVILAAGVIADTTADEIRGLVDDFVVLQESGLPFAVSQFFLDFSQVTDDDVLKILQKAHASRGPSVSSEL